MKMLKLPPSNQRLQITPLGLIIGLTVLLLTILSSWSLSTDSAHANTVSVGLVTDENTLADQGWNWTSYQGLLRAESELGVVGKVYTSTSAADYEPNLQQCVNDGNNLCISVGFLMANATWNMAQANSTVDFAIVDYAYSEAYPDNLRGMDFAVNETGYLAGTLAGLMLSRPLARPDHGVCSELPRNDELTTDTTKATLLCLKRCAAASARPLRIVLVRDRRAEEGHDRVTFQAGHRPLVASDGLDEHLEGAVHDLHHILGVHAPRHGA